jgi:hypothetical protein
MSAVSLRLTLFKRSNGVYYICYYANGRRHWKSTCARKRSEALKTLTKFKELMEKPLRNVSLRDFIGQFLTRLQGRGSHADSLRRTEVPPPRSRDCSVSETPGPTKGRKDERLLGCSPFAISVHPHGLVVVVAVKMSRR